MKNVYEDWNRHNHQQDQVKAKHAFVWSIKCEKHTCVWSGLPRCEEQFRALELSSRTASRSQWTGDKKLMMLTNHNKSCKTLLLERINVKVDVDNIEL